MSIPTQQKALFLTAKHGDFAIRNTDVPKPEAGEVLVRIEAATPSHLEPVIQKAGIYVNEYPAILGLDASGSVVALGEGVTNLSIGDKVLFVCNLGNRTAAHQQYAVVKATLTSKIPSNVSFDEAATLCCNFITAINGLYSHFDPSFNRGGAGLTPFWKEGGRNKYSGQPIVVLGASSSVGQYVIQVARLSGFSYIIAVAAPKYRDLLRPLGATHIIDRNLSNDEVSAKIRAITTEPIRIVYDAVGAPTTQNLGYDILSPDGTLVVVLTPAIDEGQLAQTPNKSVRFVFGSPHYPAFTELGTEAHKVLTDLLASGEIKPNVPEVLTGGLAGISQGWQKMASNEVGGRKLVVHPQERA